MVYHKSHFDCSQMNCQSYSAYIRVQKKWIKIGKYNSKCKTFISTENVKTHFETQGYSSGKSTEQKIEYLEKLFGIKSRYRYLK